ncbi:MAG: DUF4368 domain-containing protein, partial [Synergistaceae bacterium]|nr:DUF4368 domain-containing protein [Synergistaceae bacterium]
RAERDTARYVNKGKRRTCLKTLLGDVEFERTVYVDKAVPEGQHCVFLLDEDLGIETVGLVSPDACEAIANAICETTYRGAAQMLSETTGLTLSPQGVWDVVQKLGAYRGEQVERLSHYIRDVVLEKIVLEAVSDLADFVRCYQPVFLFMIAKQQNCLRNQELLMKKNKLAANKKRVEEIDRIIARLYEDNIIGKLTDERFAKMTAAFENEQKELEQSIVRHEAELKEADKAQVDLHMLLKGLREFTELRELTPAIVNTLIRRIEVHNCVRSDGHKRVKVDVYFTAIGMFNPPAEAEIKAMMEEIKADPQRYKFSLTA